MVEAGLMSDVRLKAIGTAPASSDIPVTVAPYSLDALWLARFREREAASLFNATFTGWRNLDLVAADSKTDNGGQGDDSAARASAATVSAAVVTARLSGGQPWLLENRCGRGQVLMLTSTLDGRWNSLPTQPDFVALVHEAVFHLVASPVKRNLRVGESVVARFDGNSQLAAQADALQFLNPFQRTVSADADVVDEELSVMSQPVRVPGPYQLQVGSEERAAAVDRFVVDYDHAEDDPTELTAEDRVRLESNDRLIFADDLGDLRQKMYGDETRTEIWHWLLWIFLALLSVEVWMTRRLVLQGHVDV